MLAYKLTIKTIIVSKRSTRYIENNNYYLINGVWDHILLGSHCRFIKETTKLYISFFLLSLY